MGSFERKLNSAVFCIAALVFAALVVLPAGELRIGAEVTSFRLTDLLGLGYFLAGAGIIAAIIGILQMVSGDGTSVIAGWAFAGLAVVTLLALLAVESVGRLVPRSFLPTTFRRFVLNLGVTAVPWVALGLCVVAAICARWGLLSAMRRIGQHRDESAVGFRLRASAAGVLAVGLLLMAVARNQSIATVSYAGEAVSVEPWAIPYLGPGSLISLLTMLVAAGCIAAGWQVGIAGSIGGALAWLSATVTGLVVATSGILVESGASAWVVEQVSEVEGLDKVSSAELASSSSPWIAYVGSILAGGAFVIAVAGVGGRR